MEVTVYTTPNCQACKATYRHLAKRGIHFSIVSLGSNPGSREELIEAGFGQAPVVQVETPGKPTIRWSGYRPDLIDKLEAK